MVAVKNNIAAGVVTVVCAGLLGAVAVAQTTNGPGGKVMLRAGFASSEIVPGQDCALHGYEFRAGKLQPGNDGVHDPLNVRVTVLKPEGGKPAVIAALDTAVIDGATAREFRGAIATALATEPARVIVAATHTHSAPYLSPSSGDPAASDTPRKALAVHYEAVKTKLVEAAVRADALVYPVNVFASEAALGLGYNRRVMTAEGLRNCWGPQEWPDRLPGPSPDPACAILLFRSQVGNKSFCLWSLGVHPVVLGKTSKVVSADFPGLACRMIEQELPGSRAMFLLGGAGNVHPWIATQEDPALIEPVARTAASFVSLLTHGASPVARPDLRVAAATLKLSRCEVDVVVWRIGSAWVVALPVELFAELSAELRRQLGGPVLLATLANGWLGYFPTRKAFDEGGYETQDARCTSGEGERLVEEVVKLARGIAD
jgi:hypothetical protein